MESSDRSPQSKRHSYPVILTYTETLSVLSENQREHNRKESISKRSKTPVLNQNGSDEERRQKLQEALDWLSQELKDLHHQDKFLLRQFNHLNRNIQELKDKREIKEENETQTTRAEQSKTRKLKPQSQEEQKVIPQKKETGPIVHGEFKLEDLKQAQIRQAQKRKAEMRLQEQLVGKQHQELNGNKQKLVQSKQKSPESRLKQQDDTKHDKRSLNSEYDSDYGSDQSVDKFEVEYLQPEQKNIACIKSPKQHRSKRWSWWK